MVTFAAKEHHCPLASTKLYCLVTEAHICVYVAGARPLRNGAQPALELATSEVQVRCPASCTTAAPGYQLAQVKYERWLSKWSCACDCYTE